ncbi:MAG: hypothetical protein JSV91_10395, partial [Phycisphaerales bacterium]
MSDTHQRVKRIEQKLGVTGPCPVCGGKGWPAVVLDKGKEDPVDPTGCPQCGKVSAVRRIILSD